MTDWPTMYQTTLKKIKQKQGTVHNNLLFRGPPLSGSLCLMIQTQILEVMHVTGVKVTFPYSYSFFLKNFFKDKKSAKNQHFRSKILDYTLNRSPKLAGLHTRDLQEIILSPCAYLPKNVYGYSLPGGGIGPAGVCWILHNGGGGRLEPIGSF